MINGEARGEPYTGKVAVAAVIMNRLKSPLFPNTLKEVIMQPYAFTCVQGGQIYLTPDVECYRAALDAVMGYDPTGGCLFYYNPRTATSRWMKERKAASRIVIGNHVFMK
ncbi:cell wall hydrolase [Caldicoprobacter faecalis]|nr:cell wall hydrolase [Caldicoprobacter faecalis]